MESSRLKRIAAWLLVLIPLIAFAQETQQLYLSGHGKDDAVPWKFFCTGGANSGFWTNLPVPSQWDVKGFGTLHYSHDATYPPPESGLYEHDFTVPAEWSGKRVFLVFEGSMTDTSAKLNGLSVGPTHQGAFYRFQYEVTRLVKFGAVNRLEVRVDKHSANDSVNRAERMADYWVFGGIFRPVHLDAVPPQFIQRVAINAQAEGNFVMDVFVDGVTNTDRVEAQIQTLDGQDVGQPFSADISGGKATLRASVAAPKLWSAETPNLYRVQVALKHDGKVIHRIERRFGFRTMEVRDGDGLYVNGRKVILKGCDRHSFWPDSGRCLSDAVQLLDINTMKDMNMNAVRMSHYPPDADFLDRCDELGLYVLDELAGWHHYYDTPTGKKLVREMVTRDVNHPCILFWDNGNEGGFNTNLDSVFGGYDPQHRRVLHPFATHGGVNTAHYRNYAAAEKLCAGHTIYMPTEFEHGLYDGGAGAGLEDYWNLMSRSKICAGGFIWALLDEGVKRPDTGKIDVVGNAAPDGIVGPYRQREASFYTIKRVWSPIQVTREADGSFKVANHYSFTDANQCRFHWALRTFRRPDEAAAGFEVLAQGEAPVKSIPPGGTGTFRLELPPEAKEADALALRVRDPFRRKLWTYVWPLPRLEGYTPVPKDSSRPARFDDGADRDIYLEGGNVKVGISRRTGLLDLVASGGKHFSLANGPSPVIGEARLIHIETNLVSGNSIVTATFNGALKKVVWTLHGDGWLRCDYTYHCERTHGAFGVKFDYPERRVQGKRWLGDGPYRVWKNRIPGTTLGVWQDAYNDTVTGWRDWVYPEFKGCFADVYWMQLQTTEGLLTVVPSRRDLFVQVLTPAMPPDRLVMRTRVSLPEAGLAFLDAIPPIGSKFHKARDNGPHGQPNVATGDYSASVSFYFGKLP